MANIEISEFEKIEAWGLLGAPFLDQPSLPIAAISAQSPLFTCRYIRFTPRGDCRAKLGLNPVATANSEFFTGGQDYVRVVNPGERMAWIIA